MEVNYIESYVVVVPMGDFVVHFHEVFHYSHSTVLLILLKDELIAGSQLVKGQFKFFLDLIRGYLSVD